jgi:hypothetical protein
MKNILRKLYEKLFISHKALKLLECVKNGDLYLATHHLDQRPARDDQEWKVTYRWNGFNLYYKASYSPNFYFRVKSGGAAEFGFSSGTKAECFMSSFSGRYLFKHLLELEGLDHLIKRSPTTKSDWEKLLDRGIKKNEKPE